MPRRFSLLLSVLFVTACAPGVAVQPTPTVVAPTSAPAPTAVAVTAVPATAEVAAHAKPTAAPAETAQVAEPSNDDQLQNIAAHKPGPRDEAALVEAFKATGPIPEVARTTPLQVKVGDVETFWVTDNTEHTNYQVKARLRYAGPVVLMYVDTKLDGDVKQADIERSAREFEQKVYPRNHSLFGKEASPGVDGDPRLTVLNTEVHGAGGYFSSSDGVTKQVNRFSNERDMFVIGIDSYPIGEESYISTLAHEFQHMIEWHVARRSPSWFNEGMSELAQDLNGFAEESAGLSHIEEPDIQLTTWSSDAATTGRHYSTSRLFLRYFYEQYGGDDAVRELVANDAGNNPDVFVKIAQRKRPDIKTFDDLVADWAVANLIDDPQVDGGRYAYKLLPEKVQPEEAQRSAQATVSQFGADYLSLPNGPAAARFDGSDSVQLVGAMPKSGRYAWWSNRGDDSVQTLTRPFDLRGLSKATLSFATWYEIEKDFDYAFVGVSTDDGKTWTTLKGNTTTNEDPQGVNFGNGLTGISGDPKADIQEDVRGKWIDETMDLTPFAGKQIQLRFWFVGDAALNGDGMLIDDIRIPELNYSDDVEHGDNGWQTSGFVRTTGVLPQTWDVRLVREGPEGTRVERVPVDPQGRAGIVLGAGEHGALVIMGSTPFTTEPARYQYQVQTR